MHLGAAPCCLSSALRPCHPPYAKRANLSALPPSLRLRNHVSRPPPACRSLCRLVNAWYTDAACINARTRPPNLLPSHSPAPLSLSNSPAALVCKSHSRPAKLGPSTTPRSDPRSWTRLGALRKQIRPHVSTLHSTVSLPLALAVLTHLSACPPLVYV